jgi:hypothetical protein
MDEQPTHSLSEAEVKALEARMAVETNGAETPLTDRELEYLAVKIHQLRVDARGAVINYLMQVNQRIQNMRAADESAAVEGSDRAQRMIPHVLELERLIAETAIHISNISDSATDELTFADVYNHLIAEANATLDYTEYSMYMFLAEFFKTET